MGVQMLFLDVLVIVSFCVLITIKVHRVRRASIKRVEIDLGLLIITETSGHRYGVDLGKIKVCLTGKSQDAYVIYLFKFPLPLLLIGNLDFGFYPAWWPPYEIVVHVKTEKEKDRLQAAVRNALGKRPQLEDVLARH